MQKSIFKLVVIFLPCLIASAYSYSVLRKSNDHGSQFVGFYVFPHGSIIIDPEHMDYSGQPAFTKGISQQKAVNLNDAMEKAADALIRTDPDIILFSTPHGLSLEDSPVIVSPFKVAGDAGGRWENFTAGFNIDQELSTILYEELKKTKNAVEILNFGSGHQTLPILWAEVIPWYFITEAANRAGVELPAAIYIGTPSQIHLTSKLTSFGRGITKTVIKRREFANKRIAVVVSGDLSHYHSNDPAAPYQYSSVAEIFDRHIVDWAQLDRKEATESESNDYLLVKAGNLESQAGHCGYPGFLMLHGMIQEAVHQGLDYKYKAHFYAYDVPTYFGMMVTGWTPAKSSY